MSDRILAAPIPPRRLIYPERSDPAESALERLGHAAASVVIGRMGWAGASRFSRLVDPVCGQEAELAGLDDEALKAVCARLRPELGRSNLDLPIVARAFALIREVAKRTLGQRHFDVQLIGGYALLCGQVAEMETGEGKTLTGTLAAATAALSGIPTHVVTVNDYLAKRDKEWMAPLYGFLGLSLGHVVEGMVPHERRAAYASDVVYCSNKELAFDYLKDRVVLGQDAGNLKLKLERLRGGESRTRRLLMRGLHYAIIDEADSVLIDEARTPLILSAEVDGPDERELAEQSLALAGMLGEGRDFQIDRAARRIELTETGKGRVFNYGERLGGSWRAIVLREEMAINALTALHLLSRDEHYLVRDGKVRIVDEYTGRIMEDRSLTAGLHQLIEVKERCEVTLRKSTLAQMTYQRFFRRYRRLSGMTGTAREIAGELWSVYRLRVVTIPTNRTVRRKGHPDRIFRTADEKWTAIAARVAELRNKGQPVLVGTRSVAASKIASQYLEDAKIDHEVLNAAQDGREAEIISRAGDFGRITIATNMAGRGTDIRLSAGVAELGGLHVILTERHDSGRIDRQLVGRCGRQGDRGSFEAILSMEDPLLDALMNGIAGRILLLLARAGILRRRNIFLNAQRKVERANSRARKALVKADKNLGSILAFSGTRE